MTNNGRWPTAIHEAAHGVAAIILGGECHEIGILDDDSGIALVDGLSRFDHAVMVAAGVEAEQMLADATPPETNPRPESFHIRAEKSELTPADKLDSIASRFPPGSSPSDERLVAEFCIGGLEAAPHRWAERYFTIHAVAAKVVDDHRAAIVRVAHELFARGVLSGPEIEKAISCPQPLK